MLDLTHLLGDVILLKNGQIGFIDIGGPRKLVFNKTGLMLSQMLSCLEIWVDVHLLHELLFVNVENHQVVRLDLALFLEDHWDVEQVLLHVDHGFKSQANVVILIIPLVFEEVLVSHLLGEILQNSHTFLFILTGLSVFIGNEIIDLFLAHCGKSLIINDSSKIC